MTTVGVFVGTRADFSPLAPVLTALATGPASLQLATAVSFDADALRDLAAGYGLDVASDAVTAVGPVVADTRPETLARAGAEISAGIAAWLTAQRIDVLVVLGDRWELLYAVPPAVVLGVRVVHLHGGEITEGALDDRIRHAVTKLADQHAVATVGAADVVRQLGEPTERVHVTGAPGLDRLVTADALDDAGWRSLLGVDVERPVALVTVHPPTVADEDPAELATAVLTAALDTCGRVLVTHPGPDPGREAILAAIDDVAADPRVTVIPSLGSRYAAVLRSVDVVVGNSSSGVIEAATVGVPAVDVGDRQAGRECAASVRHAAPNREAIADAIRAALADRSPAANPYGDGTAGPRIAAVAIEAADVPRRKAFVRRPEAVTA